MIINPTYLHLSTLPTVPVYIYGIFTVYIYRKYTYIYATFIYENSKIYDFENRAVFKVVVFKFEALKFFPQWYFGEKNFLGIFGSNIFILQIFHFRNFSKFLILKLVYRIFWKFYFFVSIALWSTFSVSIT